ncbi:MAG: PVC-type heme-binding CxxCH protein [Planctomycetota bacterium]|nr:PVC-type heme-binding CxxCH protein [Planctomycetota bacterium]
MAFRQFTAILIIFCATGGGQPCYGQRGLKDIPSSDPMVELKSFLIDEGLEVNLYASDPRMAKPIQMNFDARGRLWIASSESYPHIKPGEKASDKIIVVEDKDRDGTAETTTVFADGLLIPTGVLPGDGGCYVANSSELLHFQDTDDDGLADRRRVILSGFGTEDTHHLLHTLRWGPDGAMYMNQSIYIHSHVETPYGVKRLLGGGIWRFRPETMKLEVVCNGFVNPWGHHFDKWGQSFATDGAYGEGINYVFPGAVYVTAPGEPRRLVGLNPGSPKHCGLEILSGRHLPESWRGTMIANDFRANRVCRFVVTEDGTGYSSRQEAEVIKSSHVAFRPIDVKMGPDGAIYIADWYNPIIQHGEVDFRDERRDHVHGRIWRVTFKDRSLVERVEVQDKQPHELLEMLKVPEQWVRLNAKLAMKDLPVQDVVRETSRWIDSLDRDDPNFVHHALEAMWVYQCIDHVDVDLLQSLLTQSDHRVRAAAIRVVSDQRKRIPEYREILRSAVRDEHGRVRLEAARALSTENDIAAIQQIASVLDYPVDRFLDFALWRSFRQSKHIWMKQVESGEFTFSGNTEKLLYALDSVDSGNAAPTLVRILESSSVQSGGVARIIHAICRSGGPEETGIALRWILDNIRAEDPRQAAALMSEVTEVLHARRVRPTNIENLVRDMSVVGDEFKASLLQAAGVWRLEDYYGLVRDSVNTVPLRSAAISSLGHYATPQAKEDLMQIAMGDHLDSAALAVDALSTFAVGAAAKGAARLLEKSNVSPERILTGVLRQRDGPGYLVSELSGRKLSADVAKLSIRATRQMGITDESIIQALRQAGNIDDSGWKYSEAFIREIANASLRSGNPQRGEAIFRRADLQCLLCHSIGGAGGKVGPDLVSIGGAAQADYLVESLISPNRKIKENFHSIQILDVNGKVFTGVPVRSDDKQITIRDAKNQLVSIQKSDIDLQKEARSLMPEGAVDSLTRDEIVDLVAFMGQLGKIGEFEISKRPFARSWQQLLGTEQGHHRLNRTSVDTAATSDPELTWSPYVATVGGMVVVEELDIFTPRTDGDDLSIIRTHLEVSRAGNVVFAFNDTVGVTLWIDGSPTPLSGNMANVKLDAGHHQVTVAMSRKVRKQNLSLHWKAGDSNGRALWSTR